MNPYSMFNTTPYSNDYWGSGGNLMLPSGNANQFFQYGQPGEPQPQPGGLLQGPGFQLNQDIASGATSLLDPRLGGTPPVPQAPQQGGNGLDAGAGGWTQTAQHPLAIAGQKPTWNSSLGQALGQGTPGSLYETQKAAWDNIQSLGGFQNNTDWNDLNKYLAAQNNLKPQSQAEFLGIG